MREYRNIKKEEDNIFARWSINIPKAIFTNSMKSKEA